jgi:uncharacterized protein (TIGR03437 family)
VYSTLLWSNNLETYNSTGMALDSAGNAYITGFDALLQAPSVSSPRLTPTAGAYKSPNVAAGANHVWVTKLSTTGALVWNAVIGGSKQEQASGIDVDSSGKIYVGGSTFSADFPVTPNNGVQQTLTSKGGGNAFLAVLNPAGSQLVYGTYFGGSGTDIANAVAVIPGVGVSISGLTTSPDLPVTSDAEQKTLMNMPSGFEAVLNPPGLTIPASAISAARVGLGPLTTAANGGIVTVTYISLPSKKVFKGIGDSIVSYEFVVFVDSTSGRVRAIRKRVFVETLQLFRGIDRTSTEYDLNVPDGVYDISVVNQALTTGLGTLIGLTGTFPPTTVLPEERGPRPKDTPIGTAAIGLLLAYPPAVVNAASFAPSAVSPGEIVTIYGSNLGPSTLTTAQLDSTGQKLSTSVAGTQVFFDTDPAPIVYTSAGQASVIVPYSVQGKSAVNVLLVYNGALQDATPIIVAQSAPGIFTADGKQAAALNQDTSYNSASNPAARGSTVVLFATGEGQTNPPGVDGQIANSVYPKPALPVSVTIGGQPASVAYYGAAPGLTAGLMQLNVVVPENIQPGNAAVVLTVGTANSQDGVTVAVN